MRGAIAALAILGGTQAIDYQLRCQLPTKNVRVSYLVDTWDIMQPYHAMLSGGALQDFDEWMGNMFDEGMTSGLIRFSQKRVPGSTDHDCAATHEALQSLPIINAFNTMPKGTSTGGVGSSVLDALYKGAVQDWDVPMDEGRQFMVVFTAELPSFPVGGYPAWTPGCDCETCDYPTFNDISAVFSENYQRIIFVVTPELVPAYEAFSADAGLNAVVVPMVEDAAAQGEIMARGVEASYCGPEVTTENPAADTTPEPITEAPTTRPCGSDAILQLVHLQDMSWSYSNDLDNIKAKFPELFPKLEAQFSVVQKGLGSFVDKGIEPTGYWYDYCYRQETDGFVLDDSSFIDALDALTHKSGRDWKESQYDAIYDVVDKPGFDWIEEDVVDGKKVIRVVMLATDALAHIKGDQAQLGDDLSQPCDKRDYPSPAELNVLLTNKGVVPFFIVTSDIYNAWTNRAAGLHEHAEVFHLSGSTDELFDAIVQVLEHYCSVV